MKKLADNRRKISIPEDLCYVYGEYLDLLLAPAADVMH